MITLNAGNEGFKWFIGVVEDREDPEKLGRVRVRIYNLHDESKSLVPTDRLPWATSLMPLNSSGLNQVGISPTGLQIGSTVFGFFLDGSEVSIPVLFGVLAGLNDLPKLAQGIDSLGKEPYAVEPPSAFNAVYPYNKVTQTERGHVIEIDDTPNFERLHAFHRSGTYVEIDQDGRRVDKVVGDGFEIVIKNKTLYVQGDLNIQVKGNYSLNVDGDVKITGKTVNINNGTNGAARIGDTADTEDSGGNIGTNKIETGSGTVFIGD
jgi:hypothetical protein